MRLTFIKNQILAKCSQTFHSANRYNQYNNSLSQSPFSSTFFINKESMNESKINPSDDSRSDPNNSWPQYDRNGVTFNSYNRPRYQFNRYQSHYQYQASTSHSNINYMRNEDMNDYRLSPAVSLNPYLNSSHSYRPNHRLTQYNPQDSPHLSEDKIRELIGRFRKWHMIRRRPSDEYIEFSIMTYNILSQDLLENHSHLYQHCDQSSISWPERGLRIVRELEESKADIICLQEVHSQHFNDIIMPALHAKGYAAIFKQKTGIKLDGCAILYNQNKFSLQTSVKLELMRKDVSSILDRDNIALIVELKPKELVKSDTRLIVANTHLLYNPRRGDVKTAQIRLLLAEIDKIAFKRITNGDFDYHPIILCGDLNSEPNSLLYNFIRKGFGNFEGIKIGDISGQKQGFGHGRDVEDFHLELFGVTSDSRFESNSKSEEKNNTEKNGEKDKMFIKHNFKFRSVIYPFVDNYDKKLVSTSNCFESGLVDYIFYETHSRKLKLLGFQRLLNHDQIKKIGNIPNAYLGSDHLSLKAKFLIK